VQFKKTTCLGESRVSPEYQLSKKEKGIGGLVSPYVKKEKKERDIVGFGKKGVMEGGKKARSGLN